jgi:hypothetical protein
MENNFKPRQKPRDRHLDVPGEANRDKHMNYLAAAEGDDMPDKDDASRKQNRSMMQKIFLKNRKNKKNRKSDQRNPPGTHAPGLRHLPDDPRNLPTENTSLVANTVKKKNKSR